MPDLIQSIPFIAADATWESWNGNMLHYFGEEPLPRVDEAEWPDFARQMAQLPTFSSFGVPFPDDFATWQDWVSAVVTVVNGPTN